METYSLDKTIPSLQIDIRVTVANRDLLRELDDAIRDVIIKHYNLINTDVVE